MNVNYDRVCRLCLSSRGELLPIFPTTSSDDTEPPVLASKIKDCVSVQINENDDLPTNVCKKCMDNVNNWHIFKSVCERTQNKLQSLINKEGSQLEEYNIKSEPFSEDAYDDGVVIDGAYPDNENVASASKVQPEGPPILASLGLTPKSDKTNVDPRMDWLRVHAILNMVQDSEIIDSLQSREECDNLHHSNHESDSEGSLQPNIDDCVVFDTKKAYFQCRNSKFISKHTKLSATAWNAKVRELALLRKIKPQKQKHCIKPQTAWELLFSDDLLELVVTSTNLNIIKNCNDETNCTDVIEIKKLVGVLYLHGIMRATHQNVSDLWGRDCGIPCIQNAIDYERFKFLLQNLVFSSDDEMDVSLMHFDPMKRIRKVFEMFAMNCRTAFDVKNVAVLDEIIVPVYGPCPFRYEISKKELKNGIKMILLVDSSNFYISNLDVINDSYFEPGYIVKKMVKHLAGSGRIIVFDSWFASYSLINDLKAEAQLYTVAALHPSNNLLPHAFFSCNRDHSSTLTGFVDDETIIVSYVTRKSKCVNIISNEPNYCAKRNLDHNTLFSFYNKHKSAVEVVDVVMHYYTTMLYTNDWTHSVFFTLLNIAAINAQIIWGSQNSSKIVQRRLFIKELALGLLASNKQGSLFVKLESFNIKPDVSIEKYFKGRHRCQICIKTTKRDRRTKQACMKCGLYICREHSIFFCTSCAV